MDNTQSGESSCRGTRGRQPLSAADKAQDRADLDALMTQPLSQLTLVAHIPVFDVGAHVTRSAEVRHNEVLQGGDSGRISRPPNTTNLYLKTYGARAGAFISLLMCGRRTPIVGVVAAASWRKETDEVRTQFAHWAEVERANHSQAFPGFIHGVAQFYKRSPDGSFVVIGPDGSSLARIVPQGLVPAPAPALAPALTPAVEEPRHTLEPRFYESRYECAPPGYYDDVEPASHFVESEAPAPAEDNFEDMEIDFGPIIAYLVQDYDEPRVPQSQVSGY